MPAYAIEKGCPERRAEVESTLDQLDRATPANRERIITAWVTTWSSSTFERLGDVPYSGNAPDYRLCDHVNEVTRTGLDLAARAEAEWGAKINEDDLLAILTLHDVDKPLLFTRAGERIAYTPLAGQLQHGVIGAMLLKELGFPDVVVNTVATHAADAPFHGRNIEAFILHYADFFSADHALMHAGGQPFYQRRWA